jgi:two-component system response regulator AtoC
LGLYRLQWPGGSALLGEGEHVIGRDPRVAVVLDSASVSRRHARIRISGGDATLEDLRSKNGVSVKGSRAERPVVLSDGDTIRVGGIDLTFTFLQSADSTKTELP